jgi:hypothetical protein
MRWQSSKANPILSETTISAPYLPGVFRSLFSPHRLASLEQSLGSGRLPKLPPFRVGWLSI